MVVSYRHDYLLETKRKLKDEKIYRPVMFNKKPLDDLAECSNKMLKDRRRGSHLSEKQLNYYSFKYKKECNIGKLHFLPKMHKRLYNVPRRPVISVAALQKKHQNFSIYNHLKPIMQNSWSYIRDSEHFIDKINRIENIPNDVILITADLIGLYLGVPHVAVLKAVKSTIDVRKINLFLKENF